MKKILSLAGPVTGLLALKCPFCLLAFAGLTAGLGSLAPVVRGIYQALVIGLGILFIWFLYRAQKSRAIPGWVLGLGLAGFAGLVFQVLTETGGVIAVGSAVALSVASVASLIITGKKKAKSCGCTVTVSEPSGAEEQKEREGRGRHGD